MLQKTYRKNSVLVEWPSLIPSLIYWTKNRLKGLFANINFTCPAPQWETPHVTKIPFKRSSTARAISLHEPGSTLNPNGKAWPPWFDQIARRDFGFTRQSNQYFCMRYQKQCFERQTAFCRHVLQIGNDIAWNFLLVVEHFEDGFSVQRGIAVLPPLLKTSCNIGG